MKKIVVLTFLILTFCSYSQQKINIRSADLTTIDEENYPGAIIGLGNVFVEVDGATLQCKKAILHKKENFLEAVGDILLKQGDTITQTSKYINYDGQTKQSLSWGNVVLKDKNMTLKTDTLHFDRVSQQLYYKNFATIEDDTNVLESISGNYFLETNKFTAKTNVIITNPDYVLKSNHLDYFTDTGYAYLHGKSTIKSEESFISGEKGFSDTKIGKSHFTKNAYILYDDRRIDADSLYYDKKIAFASATNNIVITDTINKMVLKGNYAEYYRALDSAFVTKKALAISETEDDKLFMHGDTILVTGKPDHRILRAFHHVKFFKSDMQGKCDSIHSNQVTGLMRLFKKPILWTENGQITGKVIHLLSNKDSEKLDSLKVIDNAFLIQKDTIAGFNQIKGRNMYAKFKDNQLDVVDFIGNGEVLAYLREDNKEKTLFGISKTTCSKIRFVFENKKIKTGEFFINQETQTYPPSKLPENARKLRDFIWREDEQPKTMEEIFIHD